MEIDKNKFKEAISYLMNEINLKVEKKDLSRSEKRINSL